MPVSIHDFDDPPPTIGDLIFGVHWDPPAEGAVAPADLDVMCALFDERGALLELVHHANPRGANDAVVHTGDSRDGASVWDDERVFVFTRALAPEVVRIAFIVVSAGGHSFDQVRGAFCHLSDHKSERERLRVDLTALAGRSATTVAAIRRLAGAWSLETGANLLADDLLAQLSARVLAK